MFGLFSKKEGAEGQEKSLSRIMGILSTLGIDLNDFYPGIIQSVTESIAEIETNSGKKLALVVCRDQSGTIVAGVYETTDKGLFLIKNIDLSNLENLINGFSTINTAIIPAQSITEPGGNEPTEPTRESANGNDTESNPGSEFGG